MGFIYLKNNRPDWLNSGIKLLNRHNDRSEVKGFNQLSVLFTLNDLYVEYPDRFKNKLEIHCERFSTTLTDFLNYSRQYKEELESFKREFGHERQSGNLKMIRNNKKIHFYMNSGTVKICTIHSFKGWDSETVFLILEDHNFQMTFDEILYTGITRTRANLILINYGNQEYHTKLKYLIEKVK
jgi:superfamily I DNA/RNA helicase